MSSIWRWTLGRSAFGKVDLVDDRDELEVLLLGEVNVGHRLGFDALGRIHDEKGAFAGRQGAGNLVGEIDVTRSVREIELIGLRRPSPCTPWRSGGL